MHGEMIKKTCQFCGSEALLQ